LGRLKAKDVPPGIRGPARPIADRLRIESVTIALSPSKLTAADQKAVGVEGQITIKADD
jgi:hypothetical protein